MTRRRLAALLLGLAPAIAWAQPAAGRAGRLTVSAPLVRAEGVRVAVLVRGAAARERVAVERLTSRGWRRLARGRSSRRGALTVAIHAPYRRTRWRLRARAASGARSHSRRMSFRSVVLDSVGDVNLGDGPGTVMRLRGPRWPWGDVAPVLRRADIAFGNLECSVSHRGARVPKAFNFRGPPGWLSVLRRYVGFDVLNLANNHVGDYGKAATADTIRFVRANGMLAVGAGLDRRDAARPRVIRRLGLSVAFVGFSDIQPASFMAGPHSPGSQWMTAANVRSGVRAAHRRADVVVATFHWGIERDLHSTARQRAFARLALQSGATAVIGGHPHVLQPIVRPSRHRVIAYSLGNFVFDTAGPSTTSRTGILRLALSRRGVEQVDLRRAHILGTRPRL